jgi:hypothetical protein
MTRRAVEQFLPTVPSLDAEGVHPYDVGLVWAQVGKGLIVYMSDAAPGRFYLDMHCKRPATDEQAKAAFGTSTFNYYRRQAQLQAEDARIEAAVSAIAEGEPPEPTLKERATAVIERVQRADAKRVQAAADKQLTGWIDEQPRLP